ncbi:MAG: PEP-CTERM-box response regulator transcription factor [bacterium]
MEKEKILVVDDEQGIREQLYWALNDQYEVHQAADSKSAIKEVIEFQPAVITLDISLTGAEDEREGIDLIGRILDIDHSVKIIMVSGHGQKENAIECINRGATDFFTKPIDLDDLKVVINRAIHLHRLEVENKILQSQLYSKEKFEDIIGSSEQMQKLFQFIKTVAENDYTVLITGESGTDKELVARAIHKRSKRKNAPFIAINCGAIPENLLESELFGYEKGAFTDAKSQKIGKFEQAENGTIFLDEIGEMTLKLQVKLLRFLEDRRIERVGGTQLIELDVRIIAATNQDLEEHTKSGKFREDLFYRLSVLHKELPPLRERGEDIIFLSNYFLDRFGKDNKRQGLKLSSEAIQAIDSYKWPGNVRELENKIKRAVILSQNKNISPRDLNLGSEDEQDKPFATLQEVRERAEMEHLKKALVAADWNISKVSRDLATSRTTLYELMEKYQLKKQ